MKKFFIILSFILIGVIKNHAQQPEIFSKNGKAINGYDAVSFFTENKPVKGYDSFSYYWKDALWLFSSATNLKTFETNPEQYAPQYGGYCAYGTADGQGHKAPTQINTWTIVDNRLYFNYDNEVKQDWLKDRDSLIKKADENWVHLKSE